LDAKKLATLDNWSTDIPSVDRFSAVDRIGPCPSPTVTDRRRRERAQRHDLIIAAARDLAEAEGWEAVTTRRLAERVEYSQPVLYSHFDGKDAIVRAVAIEGFADLAGRLRRARAGVDEPGAALRAVCGAYLTFAAERPALYPAMFVLPIDVRFASADTPLALKTAFGELVGVIQPFDAHSDLRAEVTWAALHGLAILSRGSRIPPEGQEARIDLVVRQIVNDRGG
jgi:AcrR family transcriptional regulator